MRVLFFTDGYFPQFVSGLSVSTDIECRHFQGLGDEVAVLANLEAQASAFYYLKRAWLSMPGLSLAHDRWNGYPVAYYRDSRAGFAAMLRRFRPDVVVAHPLAMAVDPAWFADTCQAAGAAFFVYALSLQPMLNAPDKFKRLVGGPTRFLTNSQYMRAELVRRLGLPASVEIPVIYPEIFAEDYRVDAGDGDSVLFINPVRQKGLDTALALAARFPGIPFLFVRGWGMSPEQAAQLQARCDALGNVSLLPSVRDMRIYFRRARLVIAPTPNDEAVFIEAWGRVASEAQVSGIPVIATDGGGLTEAVGEGGVLVPTAAGAEGWAAALDKLWHDPDFYAQKSAAARAHAAREAIQPEFNLGALRAALVAGVRGPMATGANHDH